MMYETGLGIDIEPSSCLVVTMKAVNPVGIWETTSADLIGCDKDTVIEVVVIDAVGDWDSQANDVGYVKYL